jgi:hypothetical protein
MDNFFDFILASKLLDQLAEYNVPSQSIGHGSRIDSTIYAASEPGKSITDAAIQQMFKPKSPPAFPARTAKFLLRFSSAWHTSRSRRQQIPPRFCGYHDTTSDHISTRSCPIPATLAAKAASLSLTRSPPRPLTSS